MAHGALHRPAAALIRAALLLFLVTIVIGILNGLDVWQPSHRLLLTHVHAGTLGWISLSVIAVALLVFGAHADPASVRRGRAMAWFSLAAIVLYVAAFATTNGILRPVAGTITLAAVVWALTWVLRRRRDTPTTVPSVALTLAMVSLVVGAVLGVLYGLFLARGSIPGLSGDTAANLAQAHPPAMLIGYLILAGIAVTEWLLVREPRPASEDRVGLGVAWGLFAAGMLANVAFVVESDPLIQVVSILEVVGVVAFAVRMWRYVRPGAWQGVGGGAFPRAAVLYILVGVGLLAYLAQMFAAGRIDPEAGEGIHILLAFDHTMFLGVMTNALFGVAVLGRRFGTALRGAAWAFNLSLALFVTGLLAESTVLKRVSSPVMGLALIVAIAVLLRPVEGDRAPAMGAAPAGG